MNHNRFHSSDPQQFRNLRKCLSSFGQSVLDVMIRQREQEEHRSIGRGGWRLNYDAPGFARTAPRYERTSNTPAARSRNRRILTFNDSNITPDTSYNPLLKTVSRKTDDIACDFNQMPLLKSDNIRQTDEIPTSINLVKTIDTITTEIEPNNYSREDLFKTNRDKEEGKHKVYDLYNEGSDEGDEMDLNVSTQVDILKLREPKIVDTGKDVNWDNMFDTEIFRELESNINKNDEFIKTARDTFNVPCENTQGTPELEQSKQIQILSDDIVVEGKPSKSSKKRKHQTKITDTAPKKIKKVMSENIIKPNGMSFRKQTYTKTVNNWLKNVDPNNPVDEEHTFDTLKPELNIVSEKAVKNDETCLNMEDYLRKPNVDTTNEKVAVETKPKKLTKACKAKTAKKVVQSQLANKDGVMKFKKPKSKSISENNEQTDATESTMMQKENNKKMKIKFVAPIKSQVPVKDVTFEVVNIDGKNYTEHLNNIANSSEIILIILYSNGFCQLNSQHTDDTLSAEGVMMNIDETCYYMKHADFPSGLLKEFLPKMLLSKKIISYEAKNLLIYLATRFGLEDHKYNFNIIDAKIGGSLIDPDNPPENFSDLQKVLSFTPDYTIATECALQKAAWYISLLKDCADSLQAVLSDHSLWNLFDELEMQLLPIIADMERRGVTVDLEKLKAMESLLQDKIKSVEQECYKAAGKTFQINSPLQVRTILYDELKLDSKTNVKIRETITTGAKSTSETMLRSLMAVHPLPKLILEYRHLHKAQATFLTGIAQHVKDGVVKPTWVQTAAATGRIASNNPNLQAIPKAPFSLIMFPDPGHTESQLLNFRSVYVARPGYRLLAADFQHVECRVFAHAAADTSLLEILKGSGDLFRVLAAKWLNKQEDQVSSEDRERTKRIVYASLYGAGTRKLMDILDVSYEQTLSITASFNRTFPSLKSFGREVVSRCATAGGRLSTLGGRARHFKHITSCDFALKSHAERQAVNFVIQGSAADLCKTAMVLSERRLRASSPGVECRLVLQIHDELVWEVRETHLETAAAIIRQVMEGCGQQCGMSMKLPVAMAHGLNWGEMENLPANVE